MGKIKDYILLHLCVLLFSFTSVFSKLAALAYNEEGLMSGKLFLFATLMILDCIVYAFFWQKAIAKIDLNIGYANRSVYLIWSQLWAVSLFHETLTTKNILGLVIVLIGVLTVSLNTDYEEEGYATSEKNSFNYDSEGHLSSCSLYGVIDRIKDGERLYLEWNYKVTFDWKDGLLQYLAFDGEETENETKSSGIYKYKYYYDADYPNKYKQWGIYHGFPSVGDTYFFLPFIGLMGIGPDRLPSKMTYIGNDNQEDPDHKWNFSFTFNEDGSLATMAGFKFSYEYANGNGETRLAAPSVMTVEDGTGFRPEHRHGRHLFGGIPVTGKE